VLQTSQTAFSSVSTAGGPPTRVRSGGRASHLGIIASASAKGKKISIKREFPSAPPIGPLGPEAHVPGRRRLDRSRSKPTIQGHLKVAKGQEAARRGSSAGTEFPPGIISGSRPFDLNVAARRSRSCLTSAIAARVCVREGSSWVCVPEGSYIPLQGKGRGNVLLSIHSIPSPSFPMLKDAAVERGRANVRAARRR
jgi:hypothetical protein